MSDNNEIFEGKTFQDLTKDIYENTTKRKVQIDLLISEIHGFITTIDDVVMVAPIIKEYMDTAVKNDEHLVKLAGVLQRIISKSSGGDYQQLGILSKGSINNEDGTPGKPCDYCEGERSDSSSILTQHTDVRDTDEQRKYC